MFESHTPLLEQYLTKLFHQNQIQKMKLKSQLQKAISSKQLIDELLIDQQPVFWKACMPGSVDAYPAEIKPYSELSYFIRQK